MMHNDRFYMELALKEARVAFSQGEIPVGAVVVDGAGQVIASGYNLRETNHDATAHAEMEVIREACRHLERWRLADCTLYVTLEPCPMCAGAIVMSRIGRLVYGAADPRGGAVESIFNIPGHPWINTKLQVRAGVLEDECLAVLKDFFKNRRE